MSTAEFTEVTMFTNVREKWGRRCDYFIVLGFAVVIGAQLYMNFGPKPGDAQKASFVGPPKPLYLVKR